MAIYQDERGNIVSSTDTRKVVHATPVQARQGLLGRPVLMVLIGGLLLACVAWGVAGYYGSTIDDTAVSGTSQTTGQTTDTVPSATPPGDTTIDATPLVGEGQKVQ